MSGQPFKQPSKKRRALLAKAADRYEESLSEEAILYLKARGVDKSVAETYRLGYVSIPVSGHEQFRGSIAIPYLTPAGVVHMKFRCIQNHACKEHGHEKYDSETGTSTRMFGVLQLGTDSQTVGVCEGEFDSMVATVHAGIPSVAVAGANQWKPHYQHMFEGYSEVVVFRDADDAGKRLAEKIASELYNVRVVNFPQGEDVSSYYIKHGAAALRERAGLE